MRLNFTIGLSLVEDLSQMIGFLGADILDVFSFLWLFMMKDDVLENDHKFATEPSPVVSVEEHPDAIVPAQARPISMRKTSHES